MHVEKVRVTTIDFPDLGEKSDFNLIVDVALLFNIFQNRDV